MREHPDTRDKADSSQRNDAAIGSQTPALQEDEAPPPYSKDPKKGETTVNGEAQPSDLRKEYITDRSVRDPECPSDDRLAAGIETIASSSTPKMAEDETTDACSVRSKADANSQSTEIAMVQPDVELDIGGFICHSIFDIPGAALVSTGLIGQLARSLPAGWTEIAHVRPIIIVFSIFITATVFATFVCVIRLLRGPTPSDEYAIARERPTISTA